MRGLVLEGGGAKGAFHCGAVKALYDSGYTFDGVAGTSIGAINGALITQACGYEKMFDLWENVNPSDIADVDNEEVTKLFNKEFSKESAFYWVKQGVKVLSNSGVPTEKAISYLKKCIDENAVRNSPMDFAIVTYCLSTHEPLELFKEDIPDGELIDYVFASAYFPAFRFNKLNGKYYVDGGVYDNLPINILVEKKNYDEIFAIRTMSRMPHKAVSHNNVVIHYICPSEDLGKTADLYRKKINFNIKLGYYDALRYIKGYGGYKFYLQGDLAVFREIFMALDAEMTEKIQEKLNVKSSIFEKLYEFNGCDISRLDPYTAFFEYIANIIGLEKFKLYTVDEFLKEIYLNKQKVLGSLHSDKLLRGAKKQTYVFKEILPIIKEIVENEERQ